MKVAVFGDVHGNLRALEAMFAHEGRRADAYVCLGDVVNYGPWGDACLERIVALPAIKLLEGNHEALFLRHEPMSKEIPLVQAFTRQAMSEFTRHDLIENLPKACEVGPFYCTHTLEGRSIYADTDVGLTRDCMIGHSHHQFDVCRNGFRLVNPGSVGQNRRYIDEVCYAVVDTVTGDVALRQLTYDVDAFIAELRARNYAPECVAYYVTKPRRGARFAQPA
jgi:predicted phosphodiesterase